MTEAVDLILCRATIHLPGGLHPGWIYWVDGGDPYVQLCLDKGYLVHEVELQESAEATEAVLTSLDAPVAVDAEETVLADPDADPEVSDGTEALSASAATARVNNDADADGA